MKILMLIIITAELWKTLANITKITVFKKKNKKNNKIIIKDIKDIRPKDLNNNKMMQKI